MESQNAVLRLLPPSLRDSISASEMPWEELRLRLHKPLSLSAGGCQWQTQSPAVTLQDIQWVVEKACRASFQSAEGQIQNGFIAAPGGVRVGLCGSALKNARGESGLRDFTSLCIRIPKACPGCADGIFRELCTPQFSSTLIFAPPGGGKTTLLRELIRRLSESGLSVAVADERGELAGPVGADGFDLGRCTDVVSGMEKARAVMQLLRTVTPRVVAMDEITEPADAGALRAAVGCGASILATVHGDDVTRLRRRPVLSELMEDGAFSQAISVCLEGGKRHYQVMRL